jgi:hypothetical protein
VSETPGEQGDDHQQQRPDDVELLLHREGPEVLDRGGGDVLGEVVHRAVGQAPVHEVERRGDDVLAGDLPPVLRQDEAREHRGDDQDDARRGEQTFGAPGVEGDQRDGAAAVELGEQQSGDQEPGDDEEDVDADETAGQVGQPGVVEQHQADRDRPEALDVRAETGPPVRPVRGG